MPRRNIGAGRRGPKKTAPPKHRRKVHVRRGDRVRVIRGNFAGSEGTILRVLPAENRVVIEGVNMRRRHRRPGPQDPEGGITTFEAPIHASNVLLLDPGTDEPTRYRVRAEPDGTKERISVKSGKPIPKAVSK